MTDDDRASREARRSFSELVGDSWLMVIQIERSPAPVAKLQLHAYYGRTSPTRRQVTFEGVVAYELTGGSLDTVIFDIEALPVAEFVVKYRARLEKGRNYGWPVATGPEQYIHEAIRTASLVAFEIQSTTGTDGWFLATKMVIHELRDDDGLALLATHPA